MWTLTLTGSEIGRLQRTITLDVVHGRALSLPIHLRVQGEEYFLEQEAEEASEGYDWEY